MAQITQKDAEDLVGTRIGGEYLVEELINCTSGQALIYRVKHGGHPKDLAIKIFGLDSIEAVDELSIQAGLNEIKANIIDHPGVVLYHPGGEDSVLFLGSEHRIVYLPMEYARHGSCDCKDDSPFNKNGYLSEGDYKTILELFSGLRAIHAKVECHDDIKPANILKFDGPTGDEEKLRLKITDFGLSKVQDVFETGRKSLSGGTPDYMSPEQFDHVHHPENDIYSMGVTLYCMITGETPIKPIGSGSILDQMKQAHQTQPRPNPRTIAKGCHPRLALLIMRMMSINPRERPLLQECKEEIEKILKADDDHSYRKHLLPEVIDNQLRTKELPIYVKPDFDGVFKPEVHRRFKTNYFVFQIEIEPAIFSRYKSLIDLLTSYFSDSFSLYETWGHKDAVVLLWSTTELVEEFKNMFESQFNTEMDVNRAVAIHHVPAQEYISLQNPSIVYALAVQEFKSVSGLTEEMRESFFYRTFPEELPEDSIRAFTFIELLNPGAESKKRKMSSLVVSKVKEIIESLATHTDPNDENKRCFRKPRIVEFEPTQSYVCMVDFVAKNYKFLHELPTAIIKEVGNNLIRSTTYLETRRVTYQSDKILFLSEKIP